MSDSSNGYIGKYEGFPLEVYRPASDEVIIVKYKCGEIRRDDVVRILNSIITAFPNNKVLAIPDVLTLNVVLEDNLDKVRDDILQSFDKLKEQRF